jgi:hypothetical protein
MGAGDHQARGLSRLFGSDASPLVISVLSASGAPDWRTAGDALARELGRHGVRVLQVTSRLAPQACRPLFAWDRRRPLRQQVMLTAEGMRLHAPGCTGGDKDIVAAAAKLRGEVDCVLFSGLGYTQGEAALASATSQVTVVFVGPQESEAAYALVKAAETCPGCQEWILAGGGAGRVAEAGRRFLAMRVARADEAEEVWHASHDRAQTSADPWRACPDLPRHVARIIATCGQEANIITTYASH